MSSNQAGRFAPALLSPMPIEPRVCPLPYGLTWDDLDLCLPGFVAARSGARAWRSHVKQGLHGGSTSCVLSLGYPHADGSWHTETVFVKQSADPAAEAAKYRFLESCDLPTPRLLHAVTRGGSEVIVLEFLPTIGVEPGEADTLLRLIARLNAIERPPRDLFQPRAGAPAAQFDELVEGALTALAGDPATPVRVDPDSWLCAYQRAKEAATVLPRTLNHGELYFQQVGWSQTGRHRRLVMFDLQTMARLPRFTDIANVLAGLAAQTGRKQRELFATYLATLRELAGVRLDEDQAWKDMQLVRTLTSYQSLPWLTQRAGHPQLSRTAAPTLLTLHDDLNALGLLD